MRCCASMSQVSLKIMSSLHDGAPAEVGICLAGQKMHGPCAMHICTWEGASRGEPVEAVPDMRAGRLAGPAEGVDIELTMPACHLNYMQAGGSARQVSQMYRLEG